MRESELGCRTREVESMRFPLRRLEETGTDPLCTIHSPREPVLKALDCQF
jgi:hypothetical protein